MWELSSARSDHNKVFAGKYIDDKGGCMRVLGKWCGSAAWTFLAILLSLGVPGASWGLSLGTWNIEYFTIEGKRMYSPKDVAGVAEKIRNSSVQILALQEIHNHAVMRYLVTKHLPGWKFWGNDTGNNQDLYFLWNSEHIRGLVEPAPFFSNAMFAWEGRDIALFSRPPLVGFFEEIATGREFVMVNVHLKSPSTRGKNDVQEAEHYNDEKRRVQLQKLNLLARMLRSPGFVLGDYNVEKPEPLEFYLISLPPGNYSYDNQKSNMDHIGFFGLTPQKNWSLVEIEGSLPGRSTKKTEHPDHDMLVFTLDLE